jgi:hypothetical protein
VPASAGCAPRLIQRQGRTIRPLAAQRIEPLGDRNNSRAQRDQVAADHVGIPRPIPSPWG